MNRREFIAMTSMATLETHNLTCETARRAFEAQVVTEGIEKAQNNEDVLSILLLCLSANKDVLCPSI